MSEAGWYWRKAGECARQASETSDPRRRAEYETQNKLWRQIASRIEAIEAIEAIETNERNRVGPDPM
jgi:hypothetical protein